MPKHPIAQILLTEWDPIGIRDVPEAQDEYDRYVPRIEALLKRDATVEEIAHVLFEIETDEIGLKSTTFEVLTLIATKLKALGGP